MSAKVLAGRYELLERKGNGGMAVVYKGKDCLLDRYVAIKILRPEYISDPKFIENFRKESQAAAKLSDPNIVSVYDVGKEGNIYYIVMELMEGSSLGDLIEQDAPLTEQQTIQIASQIASGLSSAHKKKIIHRDIKPHNILMSEKGEAKIADFGIAKAVSGATVVNSKTTVMGSVHYLSPEQAKGSYVDSRTDLYSLGIVMYEMLTGTVPFDGENAVTVAMMHINNDVPAPSLLNPAVSPMMDQIVQKTAARNPADRYQSVDELLQALEEADEMAEDLEADSYTGLSEGEEIYSDGYMEDDEELMDGLAPVDEEAAASGLAGRFKRRKNNKKENNEVKESSKGSGTRWKVLGIVLALICAIPLSIVIINAVSGLGSSTVAVPDVVGMTKQEAVQTLEDKGLDCEFGTTVFSDKYKEGEVAGVEPSVGTHVKKGYTVTLRLTRESDHESSSNETETIKAPGVTGKSLAKAKALIKEKGLKVGDITYKYSDSKEEDTVLSQDPGEGEKVKTGSEIDLVVSKGKESKNVKVPDLSGMTRSEASAALEKLGLSLGEVSQEYSEKEVGTVVRQGVSAGTQVESGQKVSISLSMGKKSDSDSSKKQDTDSDSSSSSSKSSSDSSSSSSSSDSSSSSSKSSSDSSSSSSKSSSDSSSSSSKSSSDSSSSSSKSSSDSSSSSSKSSSDSSSSSSKSSSDSSSSSSKSSSSDSSSSSSKNSSSDSGVQDD